MTKPTASSENHDLRQLLAAVLEAVTLPHDADDYQRRLVDRAGWVETVVKAVCDNPGEDIGWNADFLRHKLTAEQAEVDERDRNRCGRCRRPFDPADPRFDGRGQYKDTRWCRSCIDNCHEGSAEHVCVVCEPARYGGAQQ